MSDKGELRITLHSKLLRFLSPEDADTVLRIMQGRDERIEGTGPYIWESEVAHWHRDWQRECWMHGFQTGLGVFHNHILRREWGVDA